MMKKRQKQVGFVRFVSLLAVCVICIYTFPSLAAKPIELPFVDVNETDYYYEELCTAYERGYLIGTGETTFSPFEKCTRASFLAAFHRLIGTPESRSNLPFTDIQSDAFYSDALAWAFENSIINGVDETHFAPEEPMSRMDAAVIFYRYLYAQGYDVTARHETAFADQALIPAYAADAAAWCKGVEVFRGVPLRRQMLFYGDIPLDRAQLAALLVRYADYLPYADYPQAYLPWDIVVSYYNAAADQYSVTWHGDETDLIFQLTDAADDAFTQAEIRTPVISDGMAGDYKYALVLDDLLPDCSYRYRIGNPEKDTWRIGSIQTNPAVDVDYSFLCMADSQMYSGDRPVWNLALNDGKERYPDMNFVLHCGDIVEDGSDESLWREMFRSGDSVLNHTIFMPVSGNHSYWDDYMNGKSGILENHTTIAVPPQDIARGMYYSFDVGAVHYIMLNTGDTVSAEKNLSSEQLAWLIADLESSTARFKIVTMHNPMYSTGKYGSDPGKNNVALALQRQLNPIFATYGVDLVLAGHDHVGSVTYPINNLGSYVTNKPSDTENGIDIYRNTGGTIHVEVAECGNQKRDISQNGSTSLYRYYSETPDDFSGYTGVRVTQNRLIVSSYLIRLEDGWTGCSDSFIIEKTDA